MNREALGKEFGLSRLICFTHPHYRGFGQPELACKHCCQIFVDRIKLQREEAGVDGLGSDEKFQEECFDTGKKGAFKRDPKRASAVAYLGAGPR